MPPPGLGGEELSALQDSDLSEVKSSKKGRSQKEKEPWAVTHTACFFAVKPGHVPVEQLGLVPVKQLLKALAILKPSSYILR